MGHREALALNREQPQCDLKQLAEGLNARSRTGPGKAGRLLMPLASFLHASGWPLAAAARGQRPAPYLLHLNRNSQVMVGS